MRLRYLPLLFIPAVTILAISVSGEKGPDNYEANKTMVVLRKIGHEILLYAKDSHSRVLPVKKISDQEFQIAFEKPLSLMPDSAVSIINKIAKEHNLREYIVTIKDCLKREIVYGFTVSSSSSKSIVTCGGRGLPKDCYYITMLFPGQQKNDPKKFYYAIAAIIATASLFFWLRHRYKRKPPLNPSASSGLRTDTDTASTEKDGVKTAIQLGQYNFYPDQQYLELNGEKTELTNKEASLLSLLAATPNMVIERDLLQKEIWGNEGVIVTRSLDMFISKLRKKLSGDASVKIVNVHGKGYKLEII